MAIPDYQSIMMPLLLQLANREEQSLSDMIEKLAGKFNLTDEEKKELLPSGQQPVFANRVGWARTYLKKAGLLASTKRGYVCITKRGIDVLAGKPEAINIKFLRQFDEFKDFINAKSDKEKVPDTNESDQTPEELLEVAYQSLRKSLAEEILVQVKGSSPAFFEQMVVELLVKMGYGGSRQDAGKAIGRSGDEGIDGILKEDRLGLDIIYIQAKKWENNVARDEIQKFAGALQGKRAKKGVFITTSIFSSGAKEYVNYIESKIVLVDGEQLAQLMIDHNLGVSPVSVYEVKKIDSDYFAPSPALWTA